MPSSRFHHISYVIGLIIRLKPRPASVLDVGIGFGKWGFLCREYLEIPRHYHKKDWQLRIDGIEIYEPYITPASEYIYDNIYIGDMAEIAIANYDLIIAADVIEHLDKETALKTINKLQEHSKLLLLAIPLGKTNPFLGPENNPAERHLSFWEEKELRQIKGLTSFKLFGNKAIALYANDNS